MPDREITSAYPPPPPPPTPEALTFEARGLRSLKEEDWDTAVSQLSDALDGIAASESSVTKRCELLVARALARLGRSRTAVAFGIRAAPG